MDEDIDEALGFLSKKYRIDKNQFNSYSFWLLDLAKNSTKPTIKPYHIENPKEELYEFIFKNKIEIYAEAKFDGTHVQISRNGIFKHNGSKVARDQLAYLIYLSINEPSVMKSIYEAVNEGYILECELFGKHYSPRKFHSNYEKNIDIVVFEIGKDENWIAPPEKYEILTKLGLPFPKYFKVEYSSLEELKNNLKLLALRDDTFEGVVVKSKNNNYKVSLDYLKNNLLIFKVKKEIEEPVRTIPKKEGKEEIRIDPEVLKTLESEIENEIAKIEANRGIEYIRDKKNIRNMLDEIFNSLRESHPSLVSSVNEKVLKKIIVSLILKK